jgi:hypothetical protein
MSPVQQVPKRFEAKWLKEEGIRQEVERAWEAARSTTSGGVMAKLNHMHAVFHDWDGRVLKRTKKG